MEKVPRINILSKEVVERISAGQVVDGPASVVKELLENSLDAGARHIEIDLEKGGKKRIKVVDDGCGIYPDDIDLVFSPHSTSKISTVDDLWNIATFGFRGEALFSIANVSYTKLSSRFKESEIGWEVSAKGGKILGKRPSSIRCGTEVIVEELFFNIPARRKFLRSDKKELQSVMKVIIPYLFLEDGLDVSFKVDGNMVFYSLPGRIEDRLQLLFDLPRDRIVSGEIGLKSKKLKIRYLFSIGEYARARKDLQFIFINRRPVNYPLLNYKVNQLYKSVLPSRRFPGFILWIDLPAWAVDVNVHPMKKEVKLRWEYEVLQLIERIIMSSLSKVIIPGGFSEKRKERYVKGDSEKEGDGRKTACVYYNTSVESKRFFEEDGRGGERGFESYFQDTVNLSKVSSKRTKDEFYMEGNLFRGEDFLLDALRGAKIVGVFMNKYGLMESDKRLFILDVHAAQERINYERLLSQIKEGNVEIQNLLVPVIVNLSPNQILTFRRIKDTLCSIGFLIEEVGMGSVGVYGAPVLVSDVRFAVQEILSQDYSLVEIDEIKEAIARRSCRMSIMAGDKMDEQVLEQIRAELVNCDAPLICPHGRPTIISISDTDLEKMFQRR